MLKIQQAPIASLILIAASLILTSCSNVETEAKYPTGLDRTTTGEDIYGEKDSIFGEDGLSIFGNNNKKNDGGSSGIGVNSYLWRASLDTVSFMPLSSADPFGGVIITDWYSPEDTPNERFKINVFILSKSLKSDGISVKVFRQVKKGSAWKDSDIADDTGPKMEDAILTRARQLRVADIHDD